MLFGLAAIVVDLGFARQVRGEAQDAADAAALAGADALLTRSSSPRFADALTAISASASKNFGAPRFRALYRQWLEDQTNTLWMAGSTTLADALERDHGRVECVELSRQYLHLSPLVDVA